MTNPMIVKLAETLQARIEASLANLKALDSAIADAVADAEESARNQFFLAQCQVEVNTRDRLAGFASTINELSRDAVARATAGLLDQIEAMTQPIQPINGCRVEEAEKTAIISGEILLPLPVPAPEPVPVAQPTEQQPEAEALPVAAHTVEATSVGIVTEEQIDEDGLCPDSQPTTSNPEGLHIRTGEGKQTRYVPASVPEPGQVYYQRVGRRWQPVTFQP